MNQTYERIIPQISEQDYQKEVHSSDTPMIMKDSGNEVESSTTISPITNSNSQHEVFKSSTYNFPTNPSKDIIRAMNEQDFGIARDDIHKEGKRFDWIDEELDYLVFYIKTIESDEKKNKYSNCLTHLRNEATAEVKQYFHPHHVASSDRLKNGYNTAMKRIVDSDQNS